MNLTEPNKNSSNQTCGTPTLISMQDILGSVRRSLAFRTPGGDERGFGGGLVEKIGSSLRKSRIGLFSKPPLRALPPFLKDDAPQIRWRKGELIGCGAFGRVYMGMNLDSGELLAAKQANYMFRLRRVVIQRRKHRLTFEN